MTIKRTDGVLPVFMLFHHCNVFSPQRKFKGSAKRREKKMRKGEGRGSNMLDGKNREERKEMARAAHKACVHSTMKAGPSSVASGQI